MAETSGVSMPTGLGSLARYWSSLLWGTLHPHPFILVKLVSTKSASSPCSTGSNAFIAGGFPFRGSPSEKNARERTFTPRPKKRRWIIINNIDLSPFISHLPSIIDKHLQISHSFTHFTHPPIPVCFYSIFQGHNQLISLQMIARSLFRVLGQVGKKYSFAPVRYSVPLARYQFTSSSDPTQSALLEEVEAKVYQVLKSAAKCNQAKLNKGATFQQLGFDSLDSVELVVAMEEYFGFDIPNEEAEKISTVEAAVNTFYRHLNAKMANKIVEGEDNEIKPSDGK